MGFGDQEGWEILEASTSESEDDGAAFPEHVCESLYTHTHTCTRTLALPKHPDAC